MVKDIQNRLIIDDNEKLEEFLNLLRYDEGDIIGDVVFKKISIEDIDLNGIDFSGCKFENVHMKGLNLSDKVFSNCQFDEVVIENTDLSGSIFKDNTVSNKLMFIKSKLDRADFSNSSHKKMKISNSSMAMTDFYNSDITSCKITESKLHHVNFSYANAKFMSINKSDIIFPEIKGANLLSSEFKNSYIDFGAGENSYEANLTRSIFNNCELEYSLYYCDLSEVQFNNCNMDNLTFSKTIMLNVVLNKCSKDYKFFDVIGDQTHIKSFHVKGRNICYNDRKVSISNKIYSHEDLSHITDPDIEFIQSYINYNKVNKNYDDVTYYNKGY